MVIDNDVVLVESGGIRTGRLEQYLTWLLRTRGGTVASDQNLILETEFETHTVGGAKLSTVKEIALRPIGLKQTEGTQTTFPMDQQVERKTAYDRGPPALARQVLELFGNTEADIDALLRDVPPGGDVQLRLSLFFKKGRQRGATNPTIESARRILRNMEDDAIELKSPEGRLVGKMMAIHKEARIIINGSILDYQDSARVLWETYKEWLSSGRIKDAS